MRMFFSILLLTFMIFLNSIQSSNTPRRRNRGQRPAIVNYDPLHPYNVVVDGVTHRLGPGPRHDESSNNPRHHNREQGPAIVNYNPLTPYHVVVDGVSHRFGPGPHQAESSTQVPLLVHYRPEYPYDVVVDGVYYRIKRLPGLANLKHGALVYRDGNPLGIILDGESYYRELYEKFNHKVKLEPIQDDLVLFSGAPIAKFDDDIFRKYIIDDQT